MTIDEAERKLQIHTPLNMSNALGVIMLIPHKTDLKSVISLIVDEQIVPFDPGNTFCDRLRYRLAMGEHWDAIEAEEIFNPFRAEANIKPKDTDGPY